MSTAAVGLRAGIPAVGVPMLSDQPFWAARLAILGAGPRPIRYKRPSVPALTAAIQEVTTRPSYRQPAQAMVAPLAREDGKAPITSTLVRLSS
jgi:UDP:flavonoid glycosyltransferase YjiC (YdhE family)